MWVEGHRRDVPSLLANKALACCQGLSSQLATPETGMLSTQVISQTGHFQSIENVDIKPNNISYYVVSAPEIWTLLLIAQD